MSIKNETIREMMEFDTVEVAGEYVKVPGQIAEVGEIVAEAEMAMAKAKIERDRVAGELYIAIKDSGEKLTEGAVKARIDTDPRYIMACETLAVCDAERSRIKSAFAALLAKRDALNSISASRRAEMSSGHSYPRHDDGDEE